MFVKDLKHFCNGLFKMDINGREPCHKIKFLLFNKNSYRPINQITLDCSL